MLMGPSPALAGDGGEMLVLPCQQGRSRVQDLPGPYRARDRPPLAAAFSRCGIARGWDCPIVRADLFDGTDDESRGGTNRRVARKVRSKATGAVTLDVGVEFGTARAPRC